MGNSAGDASANTSEEFSLPCQGVDILRDVIMKKRSPLSVLRTTSLSEELVLLFIVVASAVASALPRGTEAESNSRNFLQFFRSMAWVLFHVNSYFQ